MGGPQSPRRSHLRELLEEFDDPKSTSEAKRQVLANLSNFAYDPMNFEHIREVGILDTFLNQLEKPDETLLTHFACSGICNLCLDPINADHIIKRGGVISLKKLIKSNHEETALNAITSLICLAEKDKSGITADNEVIKHMLNYTKSSNIRFKNLATVFLEDLCNRETVEELRQKCNLTDPPPSNN